MAKIEKDYPISDLDEDWEGHSGGQVQTFLKKQLRETSEKVESGVTRIEDKIGEVFAGISEKVYDLTEEFAVNGHVGTFNPSTNEWSTSSSKHLMIKASKREKYYIKPSDGSTYVRFIVCKESPDYSGNYRNAPLKFYGADEFDYPLKFISMGCEVKSGKSCTLVIDRDCYIYFYTASSNYATTTLKRLHVDAKVDEAINGVNFLNDDLVILPQYSIEERDRVAKVLRARIRKDVAVFTFNTDQHFDMDNKAIDTASHPIYPARGIRALADIYKQIPMDIVVFGGDMIGYGTTAACRTADGIAAANGYMVRLLAGASCPVVTMAGNHDAFQNTDDAEEVDKVTKEMIYNTFGKFPINNKGFVHLGANVGCNGYFDEDTHKIRYVFVDTESDHSNPNSYKPHLDTSLSTMKEGYKAVIMSHNPLTDEFHGVLLRYNREDGTVDKDAFCEPSNCKDIIDQYAENIIVCICGHSHIDGWGASSSGILYILTTCACAHTRGWVFMDETQIPTDCVIGTATDTSWDAFVIDQNEQTIEAVRYGQGCNRKWRYKGDIGYCEGYPQQIVRE